MQTVASSIPDVRRLSESLYVIEDICNVYVVVRGERALLIDSGMGTYQEALTGLGIRQVEWVLHTHFHRDQCDGTARLAAAGSRVAAPGTELDYFAGAQFWQTKQLFLFDNLNTYDDFAAPLTSLHVDHALVDGATFTWHDLQLRVVPAPGHTKGSIALAGEIDGRHVAFTGDTIHHSARPWTLFDLEWFYASQEGVNALSHTLHTLAGLGLDLLLPSHGAPIGDPAGACKQLIRRLGAYHEWLRLYGGTLGFTPLPAYAQVQSLTPHLWCNTSAFANSYALLDDDGAALFLDYGFPSFAHLSANTRFVEHTLDDLRRVAGLTTVDVVLPSHYHDDHVCGFQFLQERYGAKVWVFENQADILAHPEAYKLPGLWSKPMTASRVFGDGETFGWRSYAFTAAHTPGHTHYHCAVSFAVDGRRVVHAGDTLGQGLGGPLFGFTSFQNRVRPGDFLASVARIRDFEPDYLLTGHWGAWHVEPAFLDEALRRARAFDDILQDLIAVPDEAGFAFDPHWATLYPYQATAQPGVPCTITARLVNHLSRPTCARVALRLPQGWICEPDEVAVDVDPAAQGTAAFQVTVPADSSDGQRCMIAATVTLDERRFGPVAEGIVLIQDAVQDR
jgi:glyoxylase-like metal-dependent hydrolase (beta-lactamase superfamily II)